MPLSLAPNAPAAFLSANYLNQFADQAGTLLASTGQQYANRIRDMVPSSIWQSIASSDAVQETLQSDLYVEGAKVERSIGIVAALNHNLKDFSIELKRNGIVIDTKVFAGVAASNTIQIYAADVALINEWRLVMDTTQSVDAEKEVGVIAIGLLQHQMSVGFPPNGLAPAPKQNTKSSRMARGSTRYAHIFRADDGFTFDTWNVRWDFASQADLDALLGILNDFRPFMFMPEPGKDPGKIRLARFVPNTFQYPYTRNLPELGYSISAQIEDLGGA